MNQAQSGIVVECAGLARHISVTDDRISTDALSDGGRILPVQSHHEFKIIVDGKESSDQDMALKSVDVLHDGSLSAVLEGESGLCVVVRYEAHPEWRVILKWLEISGSGALQRVEVENWNVANAQGPVDDMRHEQIGMGPMGLGQPLYVQGFFVSMEHPGSENFVHGQGLACAIAASQALSDSPFRTTCSVTGSGVEGKEWTAVMDYLEKRRPMGRLPFTVLVNNWYQFGAHNYTEAATISSEDHRCEIDAMWEKAGTLGLPLDFYCLDDPWTEGRETAGRWDTLDPGLLPDGLPRDADGRTNFGLWVGPFGGYAGRKTFAAAAKQFNFETFEEEDLNGFGSTTLCAHGTRYHEHLRESFQKWASEGVHYWKFDGVGFECTEPDHGHAVGAAGRVDQVDRWIELMQAIREIQPDSVIAFTTGSSPSPWWLLHVDFIWRGGFDDSQSNQDSPRRERFATYIDGCLDVLRPTAMPVASVVVFGLIQNAFRNYKSDNESIEDFERFAWHMVARGSHHHDLYVAPDSLSDSEWEVMTRVLNWARERADILSRSRMVLGSPTAGDVYGFSSYRNGQAILMLRNPSGAAQEVSAALADLLPHETLPADVRFDVTRVTGTANLLKTIGATESLSAELQPYEVLLVELAGLT